VVAVNWLASDRREISTLHSQAGFLGRILISCELMAKSFNLAAIRTTMRNHNDLIATHYINGDSPLPNSKEYLRVGGSKEFPIHSKKAWKSPECWVLRGDFILTNQPAIKKMNQRHEFNGSWGIRCRYFYYPQGEASIL